MNPIWLYLGAALAIPLALLALYLALRLRRLQRGVEELTTQLRRFLAETTDNDLLLSLPDPKLLSLTQSLNRTLARYRQIQSENRKKSNDLISSIAQLSHDLRTPLTSALGYVQMLEKRWTEAGNTDDLRRLVIVRERLEVLHNLLEQLFQYVKAEAGNEKLKLQHVAIDNLLRDQFALFYERFEAAGLTVDLSLNTEENLLFVDEMAMLRILNNLFSNVLRYATDYAGVYTFVQSDKLHILVYNGLSAERGLKLQQTAPSGDLSSLTEQFQVLDESRPYGSSGLGLAIVERYLQRLQGQLKVYWREGNRLPLLPPSADSPIVALRERMIFVVELIF